MEKIDFEKKIWFFFENFGIFSKKVKKQWKNREKKIDFRFFFLKFWNKKSKIEKNSNFRFFRFFSNFLTFFEKNQNFQKKFRFFLNQFSPWKINIFCPDFFSWQGMDGFYRFRTSIQLHFANARMVPKKCAKNPLNLS